MCFLDLGFEDAVPDAKTVWLVREHLTRTGAIDDLFAAFDGWLKGKGYLADTSKNRVIAGSGRIEGSNAYHWVFHSAEAVVHQASPTRGAVVVREMMDGHRPAVWISDRYTAQQGHAAAHQTCLAHLARDVAYVVEGDCQKFRVGAAG